MSNAGAPVSDENGTLLAELVGRYRAPVGLAATAVAVAPNLVNVPIINRYEVWGAVVIFIAAVFTASLTDSRRVLAGVAVAGVLVFVAGELALRDHLGGLHEEANAAEWPVLMPPPASRRTETTVGPDPIATIRAFRRRWVLHTDGTIDGLNADGTIAVTYRVDGPAVAIAACGHTLIVTHARGKVARVSPTSGKVLTDYPYSSRPSDVVCGGGFVWVSKPDRGSVVQLRERTLGYVDEFPLVVNATSIAYGAGAIWVLDGPHRQVVGVIAATKEKVGPYAIMGDGQQILFADDYVWVLHREQSCLKRLDFRRGEEIGPGVPLGNYPYRMRHRDGIIYVADYADATILEIDAGTVRPSGKPILFGKPGRLTDADEHGGRLVGIDTARNRVVIMGEVDRARQRAKWLYAATPECPSR